MPSRYLIRNYQPNNFYHIANFGNRELFLDEKDYQKFIFYLKLYAQPINQTISEYPNLPKRLWGKNLSQELELISFCLLPNHFHLILKPLTPLSIPNLLKQLTNAYTYYFNQKYSSNGPIFKGRYKSVQIESNIIKQLSRHLHLHPGISWLADNPKKYQWSSLNEYLTNQNKICNQQSLLNQFDNLKEFEKYTTDEKDYNKTLESIKNLLLDSF